MSRLKMLYPSLLLLLVFPGGAAAQQSPSKQAIAREVAPAKLSADLMKTMKAYQASLEELLKIYDEGFKKRAARVEKLRGFYEKGYIARIELDQSERELAETEARLRDTEQKIAEVQIGIAEATALGQLVKLPPLRLGGYMEKGAVIRYNGAARWSLAGAAKVQKFFAERFGRALPVSALGQTPFHDRMQFDHREAVDVALHPDSLEGRSLMAYLRTSGIPFTAFRNGVPGSASGAHIHIGKPSLRTAP